MTLLLTFFVLLLSFSSFDEAIFQKLKVIFADALPSTSHPDEQDKDAFLPAQQIQRTIEEISEGSEKPTLETGKQDRLKEETKSVDFRSRKVFLISSEKIFWGKGATISLQGRQALATIASFLKQMPSRVVISETCLTTVKNGPADKDNKQFSLPRAWAVTEFFIKKQGLDKNRFSISAASTVPPHPSSIVHRQSPDEAHRTRHEGRQLEIVLLERSIYK